VEVEALEKLLEPMRFAAGETIVRKGDAADRIYFLVEGEVSVVTELPSGELAALSRAPRWADVRADGAASCFALPLASFERLGETRPGIKLVLLENLLGNVCQTVARLTQEVAALAH
jgi:CRP-like cAMP-binding protein